MPYALKVIAAVIMWWPIYLVPALIGCLLVYFPMRRSVRIVAADWLLLVVPWIVWLSAMQLLPLSKSMSNLVEAFAVSAFAILAFLVRCLVQKIRQFPLAPWVALVVTSTFSVILTLLVPGLPE